MTDENFRPDVVVVGSLWNFDMAMAESLTRGGLDCVVVRWPGTEVSDFEHLPGSVDNFTSDRMLVSNGRYWFYNFCRRSRCVVSVTGAVTAHLGHLWLALPFLPFPPIVNITTGSDISELAVAAGLHGTIYRHGGQNEPLDRTFLLTRARQ